MTESFILMALGIGIGYSIRLWLSRGGIEELARKSGAEIVMFVDKDGKLVVVDTDTGIPLPEFEDSKHELHTTEIRFSDVGEPVLYDMKIGQPIVEHKKLNEQYREPVANPNSGRNENASVIYFWRFSGTSSCCTWSGGKHRVRRR